MIAILQYRRRWFPGIMALLDGCGTAGRTQAEADMLQLQCMARCRA